MGLPVASDSDPISMFHLALEEGRSLIAQRNQIEDRTVAFLKDLSSIFHGQTKLSKYGNARLRRTLWMAGQVAILQRTNSFRDKFERYIAKDRQNTHLRRKAYTAIAAKIARTVHGIIKRGARYCPFFEG